MKKILVLGSTGSIGVNTLKVVKEHSCIFKITGLSCNKNVKLLEKQINETNAKYAAVNTKEQRDYLKSQFPKMKIFYGKKSLEEIAAEADYDIAVISVVGAVGLPPVIRCLERGKRAAIANKEPLVIAGDIIKDMAQKHKTEIIPIDSEHSAIFQSLKNEKKSDVNKILLTASGGPFFNKNIDFNKIKPEHALAHPKWNMGRKITIDSATLMNKGLEVIEARWLFDIPANRIEVVIHPQSIIHSMVEYIDGSIIAQLGITDMKIPIQYALAYPDRLKNKFGKVNFFNNCNMTFHKPDMQKFRCLELAYIALKKGGIMPSVLNASNEIAVNAFLNEIIAFDKIPVVIETSMTKLKNCLSPSLDDILDADTRARIYAEEFIKKNYFCQ